MISIEFENLSFNKRETLTNVLNTIYQIYRVFDMYAITNIDVILGKLYVKSVSFFWLN